MDAETIAIIGSNGGRVIPRSQYIVVDKGERDNHREVAGLDANGGPEEHNSFCVISGTDPVKVYHGDNLTQLRARMRSKTADISIGKIDDTDDIETAVAAGRVNKEINSETSTIDNLSR